MYPRYRGGSTGKVYDADSQSYVSMAMRILIMTIDKLSFVSDTWPPDSA